jgi:hypothetical protein
VATLSPLRAPPLRALLACVLMLPALRAGAALAQESYSQEAVKAAFLYRFADFIDWPSTTDATHFTIGVLADRPVAAQLQLLLRSHLVKGKAAEVRAIESPRQLADAQILYIGRAYPGGVHRVMEALGRRPILIVSDEDNGLSEGAMINFLLVDRRVRFEVSLAAADRARLQVSSELLSVAVHVQGAHQ